MHFQADTGAEAVKNGHTGLRSYRKGSALIARERRISKQIPAGRLRKKAIKKAIQICAVIEEPICCLTKNCAFQILVGDLRGLLVDSC